MPPAPRWISISAASALGLGLVAAGAVGVANSLPLVDSTTQAPVPPISTVPRDSLHDVKGSAGTGNIASPIPASSAAPSISTAPSAVAPAPPEQAPVPQPQTVSPASASPSTPASGDSAD